MIDTKNDMNDSIQEVNLNYPDYIEKIFAFKITRGQSPERVDRYLARSILNATRTKVQKAIDAGNVTINGLPVKSNRKIQPGDDIQCIIMKPPPIELLPENIPLEIFYEDDYLLVVNKPAGMCTHPGYGNRYGTLVNAVLYHTGFRNTIVYECDEDDDDVDEGAIFASDFVRPGVVHRLDKDTSGLLLVSKNPEIHAKLALQFSERTIQREYRAIVWGLVKENSGTITGDIGRSTRNRKLFDVVKKGGKHAITEFEVLERYDFASLLRIHLRTGRTHQIRVHFSNRHHPVFGDPAYGGDTIVTGGSMPEMRNTAARCLKMIRRQMLHAATLGFVHPVSGSFISFECPLPADMQRIIDELKK